MLVILLLIVKSKVTTESQPAAFTNVNVAVLLLDEYTLPSIQTIVSQAT